MRADVDELQRALLRKSGYIIVQRPLPIETEEILGQVARAWLGSLPREYCGEYSSRLSAVSRDGLLAQVLRDAIESSGCCGIAELLKLQAYTLTQYEKVAQAATRPTAGPAGACLERNGEPVGGTLGVL